MSPGIKSVDINCHPVDIAAHLLKAYAAVAAGVAQMVIRAVLGSVAYMLEVYAVIQLSVVLVGEFSNQLNI